MRTALLFVALLGLSAVPATAATPSDAWLPAVTVPQNQSTVERIYAKLHLKAQGVRRVRAGRDVLAHGRARDGKHSHTLVRREARRLRAAFQPWRQRVLMSTAYLYRVQRKAGTWAMIEVAFDQHDVSEYDQACWRRIIEHESHGDEDAANSTSSARGILQYLDTWASLRERLDAVWSILRGLEYRETKGDFDPWFLTRGSCR